MTSLSTLLAQVASGAFVADGPASEAGAPLMAGTAPLLSPVTLAIVGAGLVGVAVLRSKLRQHSE